MLIVLAVESMDEQVAALKALDSSVAKTALNINWGKEKKFPLGNFEHSEL